ncbi:unnamed protein product, partial [Polarella glacialis]
GSGVMYLDSPGYEDTAGPEVDFATSISYHKVAATCGQLRFLVLVSCASFLDNRGGAIRSLTKLLSSLVHGFDMHKLAFSFLFTHVHLLADAHHPPTDRPEGDYLAIAKGKVAALLSETFEGTDKKDKQSRDILRWLMRCAEKGFPFLDVFDRSCQIERCWLQPLRSSRSRWTERLLMHWARPRTISRLPWSDVA